MNVISLTKYFGNDLKLEVSLWSFFHVCFVQEKNYARNLKKESQMKAKFKTFTKPSNLTEGFKNHLIDYSTRSTIANVLWMFFKCILIFLGRQQSKYSITLHSKTGRYVHGRTRLWWRQVNESFFQSVSQNGFGQ